jgi:hypothetical protein
MFDRIGLKVKAFLLNPGGNYVEAVCMSGEK